MGQHWVPDGNGGFVEAGGDSSLVGILMMPVIFVVYVMWPTVITIPMLSIPAMAYFMIFGAAKFTVPLVALFLIAVFMIYAGVFALVYLIMKNRIAEYSDSDRRMWFINWAIVVFNPLLFGLFMLLLPLIM